MSITTRLVDYNNTDDAQLLVSLLNNYALDPMGGGEPLSDFSKDNLAKQLAQLTNAFSVFCFVEGKPAGLINCFVGFSTFKCKPVVNIHDVVVLSEFRGKGLSLKMMELVEATSSEKGACKMTLEVLEGNIVAQKAYQKFGFSGYELDPAMGKAMFWEKPIK